MTDPMTDRERDQEPTLSRVAMGLLIMAVGLLMLADTSGWLDIRFSSRYWPFIVLVFGVLRLLDPPVRDGVRRSRRSGAWLIYIGLWGLVNEFHVFGLDYGTSWPLMIVGAGLAVIWRAFDPDDERRSARSL